MIHAESGFHTCIISSCRHPVTNISYARFGNEGVEIHSEVACDGHVPAKMLLDSDCVNNTQICQLPNATYASLSSVFLLFFVLQNILSNRFDGAWERRGIPRIFRVRSASPPPPHMLRCRQTNNQSSAVLPAPREMDGSVGNG
jgi:hypothetical protein